MNKYLKKNIKIVKCNCIDTEKHESKLVNEHNLKLFVEGKCVKEFICLNEHLDEIVVGWLLGNNYLNSYQDLISLKFKNDFHEVYVKVRHVQCDKTLEDNDCYFKNEWIFNLVNEFLEGTKIHKQTSGTHCCILSLAGKISLTREDIGRHNAIDKVIGYIYMNDINASDCIIFTSGRISSDLVSKVINAKIPVLVSKSVTSFQAAELANGKLCLICKAWPDSFEIYSCATNQSLT